MGNCTSQSGSGAWSGVTPSQEFEGLSNVATSVDETSTPRSNIVSATASSWLNTKQNENAKEAGEGIFVMYLFSSPFTGNLSFLDSKAEISRLEDTLRKISAEANINILFEALVATSHNRLEALQNRPNILYIAGHGNPSGQGLYMEDSAGNCQEWTRERIQNYFETSKGMTSSRQRPIQCAILGACGSESLARLFMEYGNIRHVVAVRKDETITDNEMFTFVRAFLENILKSKPVDRSFKATLIELEDDYQYSAKKFVIYHREGASEERLFGQLSSTKSAGLPKCCVRNNSPQYQFQCKQLPVHYINQDIDKLKQMYQFLANSKHKRALVVLQAPRGCGSTTMAIRLAYHLAPRRVFHGIYYIPLEAFIYEKEIEHFEESCIVRCIVESLQKDMPGLESCQSFGDLISVVTDNLNQHQKQSESSKASNRILFIFDGCCLGEEVVMGGQEQLRTTLIARLITQFLVLADSVSVLAVCHNEVAFPLDDGHIVQMSVQLGAMSDLDIARLLLRDSVRKISLDEFTTADQKQEIASVMNESETRAAALAEEFFSQSPIVRELQGMPAAARIFSRYITHKGLQEVDFYVNLVKQSVAHAIQIKRPFLTDYTRSPRSKTDAVQEDSPRSMKSHSDSSDDDSSYGRESDQARFKSAGCESDEAVSLKEESLERTIDEVNDFAEFKTKKQQDAALPAIEISDADVIWERFRLKFHENCRRRKLSDSDKKVFHELATIVQDGQSSIDCNKLEQVTQDVLFLVELLPDLLDDPTPLVHFITASTARECLMQSDLRYGNCLFHLCEDNPRQLALSWVALEGGEKFQINVHIAVEAGPRFRCGDKAYGDLSSIVRDKGGGTLWFLYPNVLIDKNKDLEHLNCWLK